jgi:mono/diheme cytochrome c family protein
MRASQPASRFQRAAIALALVSILTSACKPVSLPDATSPGAQLYVSKCGNCHVPYNPHEMTASMWDTQVTMMEVKIQAAGMPPLTSDERASIVEYLKRNAGTQ